MARVVSDPSTVRERAPAPFAGSHPAAPVVQTLVRTDAGCGPSTPIDTGLSPERPTETSNPDWPNQPLSQITWRTGVAHQSTEDMLFAQL